jgi:hypothetical protein
MMIMSYLVSNNSESIYCQDYGPLQTILHIAQENAMKLTTMTVCVDYSDIFKFALAYNQQILKDYRVVTTPQDKDTHALCQQYGLHVIATNSFYDDGAVFNKGKAINDGLEQSRTMGWVLLLDADIFLPPQFLDILSTKQLDRRYLYSANRLCIDKDLYQAHRISPDYLRACLEQQPNYSGYFQLFHTSRFFWSKSMRVYPEGSANAAWSDMIFADFWPESQRRYFKGMSVIHFGPRRVNYNGRISDYYCDIPTNCFKDLFSIRIPNETVIYL